MDKARRMILASIARLTPDTRRYLYEGISRIYEEEMDGYKEATD